MKSTTNKFDYPTAASHTYKKYRQQIDEANINQQQLNKKYQDKQRYQKVIRQQQNNQRFLVKAKQKQKKQQERQQNRKNIEAKIQSRRRQLEALEQVKAMAIQAQKKGYEQALIRQEQQRVFQIQKDRRQKENQIHAQNRFVEALRRMETEKDQANKKNQEALFRRKVTQNVQKIGREKAMKYRLILEQQERIAKPEQKRTFKDYKQSLGLTAYAKTVDYAKSHIHNPMIIIPNSVQQDPENALIKAQQKNNRQEQRLQQKSSNQLENRRVSKQRGQKAMEKIKLEKQYGQYLREQEANAIKYNIQRVQSGKKNQYVGMKPATLAQMEAQRKIRRQDEFQKMFFGGEGPQCFLHPATRYNIEQAKLGDTQIPNKIIHLSKGNPRSNQAVISDGHYSFESQAALEDLTTVKKNEFQQQPHHSYQQNQEQQIYQIKQYEQKRMAGTFAPINKQKLDLNYSESEEQDSYNY